MDNTIIDPDFFQDASCVEEILLKAESLGLSLGEIFPDMARGYSVNVHDDYLGNYFVVTTDGNFSWFDRMGRPIDNPGTLDIVYPHYIPPGLRKVVVPEGAKVLNDHAFRNSRNTLVEISLPSSLEVIHDNALFGCSKISSLRIPENVSFMGMDALDGCVSLSEISAPAKVRPCIGRFLCGNPQAKVRYF